MSAALETVKDVRPMRSAVMTLSDHVDRQLLTAHVPGELSADDFGRVARQAYDVISKLTNHPCFSGSFDFIVSREQLKQVINVAL